MSTPNPEHLAIAASLRKIAERLERGEPAQVSIDVEYELRPSIVPRIPYTEEREPTGRRRVMVTYSERFIP